MVGQELLVGHSIQGRIGVVIAQDQGVFESPCGFAAPKLGQHAFPKLLIFFRVFDPSILRVSSTTPISPTASIHPSRTWRISIRNQYNKEDFRSF
jgi:hypothetical protein